MSDTRTVVHYRAIMSSRPWRHLGILVSSSYNLDKRLFERSLMVFTSPLFLVLFLPLFDCLLCSVRRDGRLLRVDRAGHPSVSSFFNTDETKEEYNASEPVNDYKLWLEVFIHLMGHTGNYTREEAIAAINEQSLLPDMLSFNPLVPAAYPNGRSFADDVINAFNGARTKRSEN